MMKRRVFLIILAAVLCISAVSYATELTWDQTCTQKTSAATMLYVLIEGDESLTSTSMLPAGTYIRTNGLSMEGKTGISYSANNRDPLYGYIDGSVIVSAAQTITLPSGTKVTVSEALVRSKAALNLYLDMEYGETIDGSSAVDENGNTIDIGNEAAYDESGLGEDGDALWAKGVNAAARKNGSYTQTVFTDDDGSEIPVDVVYMGLARSMVVMNGKKQLVETWRLSWETDDVPEDKVLAVVVSSQGKVKLHSEAKSKSTVINRVLSNRVLRVISVGKDFTLVDIDDDETPRGYIATAYLEFYPNIPMIYRSAKLSVLGRTKGSDPVWIRSEDSSEGAHLVQFDLGEPMSVYAQNDKWSEIDIGGFHAFILSEYVTFDDAIATAGNAEAGE